MKCKDTAISKCEQDTEICIKSVRKVDTFVLLSRKAAFKFNDNICQL